MKLVYERHEALKLFMKMAQKYFEGYEIVGVEYTEQHEFIVDARNKPAKPSLSKMSDYQPNDVDNALGES